jgi:formylglycine-generating enzyme required for sulfatase activity
MHFKRNLTLLTAALALSLTTSMAHAERGHRQTAAPVSQTANSLGIEMVTIPAGSFIMGSCKLTQAMQEENKKRAFIGLPALTVDCGEGDPDAYDSETPQHRVSIRSFQMGKTEVTLGQFKRFIAATGNTQLVNDDFIKYNASGDDAPVVMVSWDDAQAYIQWLNQTQGGGYRLPTEAEWEYACRAGNNTTYCGSNNVGDVAWYDGNSGGRTHPVAQKQANAFGLYDMSGNVSERVQDAWHGNYNGAPTDGSAWAKGGSGWCVLRGGSWYHVEQNDRPAARADSPPTNRSAGLGFRLARALP